MLLENKKDSYILHRELLGRLYVHEYPRSTFLDIDEKLELFLCYRKLNRFMTGILDYLAGGKIFSVREGKLVHFGEL